MLSEQIEGHQASKVFAAGTNSKLATFIFDVKVSSCIFIHLEIVDGGLEETVKTHVDREYVCDDQLGWVRDSGLGTLDCQTKAHAVLLSH